MKDTQIRSYELSVMSGVLYSMKGKQAKVTL
jgi:hypothetical protein